MNKLVELWEDLNLNIPSVAVIVTAFILEVSFVIFIIMAVL